MFKGPTYCVWMNTDGVKKSFIASIYINLKAGDMLNLDWRNTGMRIHNTTYMCILQSRFLGIF